MLYEDYPREWKDVLAVLDVIPISGYTDQWLYFQQRVHFRPRRSLQRSPRYSMASTSSAVIARYDSVFDRRHPSRYELESLEPPPRGFVWIMVRL